MTCAACVKRVEDAIKKVPGVEQASVNLATEKARVTYIPGDAGQADFIHAVEAAGYGLVPEDDGVDPDSDEKRKANATAAGVPAPFGFVRICHPAGGAGHGGDGGNFPAGFLKPPSQSGHLCRHPACFNHSHRYRRLSFLC